MQNSKQQWSGTSIICLQTKGKEGKALAPLCHEDQPKQLNGARAALKGQHAPSALPQLGFEVAPAAASQPHLHCTLQPALSTHAQPVIWIANGPMLVSRHQPR